jgi:hypothetical protein
MKHVAETGTFRRDNRLLEVALAAWRDIVHLRPDVWCGGHGGRVVFVAELGLRGVGDVRRTSITSSAIDRFT